MHAHLGWREEGRCGGVHGNRPREPSTVPGVSSCTSPETVLADKLTDVHGWTVQADHMLQLHRRS